MPAVLPPLRSSRAAADIDGFFHIVGDALEGFVKTEGAPMGTAPIYIETFPKERLTTTDDPFDVITFHVVGAEMAATSNDGNRIPRAPQLREIKVTPHEAGYNTAEYGWWETYTVDFTVWSKGNSVANALTLWFHRFLIRYAYYYKFFEAFGIQQIRFVGRGEDGVDLKENQELYKRTLRYTFRLEFLDKFQERQLTDLSMHIKINRDVKTVELESFNPA